MSIANLRPARFEAIRPTLSIAGLRASRPGMFFGGTVAIGALTIAILNLLLHIATSNAVYELSSIQKEKKELITTTQILGEQVDSLSSQQNLSNSAQKLGMISNSNPVFLRLADQKVFGKPKAALNTAGRVSRNLVPNAALIQQSTMLAPVTEVLTVATEPTTAGNVAKTNTAAGQVISFGGAIPASPTH